MTYALETTPQQRSNDSKLYYFCTIQHLAAEARNGLARPRWREEECLNFSSILSSTCWMCLGPFGSKVLRIHTDILWGGNQHRATPMKIWDSILLVHKDVHYLAGNYHGR